MNFATATAAPSTFEADAIAVTVSSLDDLAALDAAYSGQLVALLDDRGFTGKAGSLEVVPGLGKIKARNLIVAGVGKGSTAERCAAAGAIGFAVRGLKTEHLAVDLGQLGDAAEDILENIGAGNYRYDRYRTEDARTEPLDTVTLLNAGALTDGFDTRANTRIVAQSFARDLVNAPPADLYPATLAEAAQTLSELKHIEVEVIDIDECDKRGLVGVVAVGQGSANDGCVIHIRYRPPGASAHIALVGKGVTFDAGGLSLKPSGAMQTMRCDMGGAATMLAATQAAAGLGVAVNIDCFLGAVENMVGANSFKLGDILTYNNGVTVEIHNTDAEGRLVLADCLLLANETDATTIVDAATLTGAVVVALGPDFTGLFTDSDELATELSDAAKATNEGLWRLPLHAPYNRMLKAQWGQIKNVGGRDAGSTTAALFLKHFVDDSKRWAHLDIAGSAFTDSKSGHYEPGGTGEMVRSLTRWIAAQA